MKNNALLPKEKSTGSTALALRVKETLSDRKARRWVFLALLLVAALLSIFVFSRIAMSAQTYSATIRSIDEKKATVMTVTATAATASTLLSAVPGDVTNPVADHIMEMSAYLLLVVCALVLEKSLITVIGYLSFNILIPIACVLLGIYLFCRIDALKKIAVKIAIFALVAVFIIPASVGVSDLICEVNRETIDMVSTDIAQQEEEKEQSWLGSMLDLIGDSITQAGEYAKKILNTFTDAIATFVIAYCVIPVLVLLAMVWFMKFLFGINIPIGRLHGIMRRKIDQRKSKELATASTGKNEP